MRSGCPERVFEERPLPSGGVASLGPEPAEWGKAAWFLKAEARLAQLDPVGRSISCARRASCARKSGRAGFGDLDLLSAKPLEREQRARIASALSDYRRARDELSRAGSEWLMLPGPDSGENADRTLASLAAISMHALHDLVGAAEVLSRSTAGSDPAKSEPLLRIELLRGVSLPDREEGRSPAQPSTACSITAAFLRLASALCGDDRPGLRFRGGRTLPRGARGGLAEVTPPAARFVLLEPLERCPSRDGVQGATVDRFLTLLPALTDQPPAASDRAVLGIRLADACRVVGRQEPAVAALRQALNDFESALVERKQRDSTLRQQTAPSWEPIALLVYFRAADRVGIGASAIPEAGQALSKLALQYQGENDLVLLATGWVEQAERALQARDAQA